MTPAILPLLSFGESLVSLASEYIEDKDKLAEFAFKSSEQIRQFSLEVLKLETTPKVDAFVKLMYAFRDVGIPLVRPIVSSVATGFAAYCSYKGITLPDPIMYSLSASFPSWMAMREYGKAKDRKLPKPIPKEEFNWETMGGDK